MWRAPRGQQSRWSHRNRQKRTQLELGTQLRRASRLESFMRTGVLLRGKEPPQSAPASRSIGKPWAADCDNSCHQAPVGKPGSTDGPEISGLSPSFSWWSWGESNPRPPECDRPRYDHSRDCGSRLPHRRVGWATRARPQGLSPRSAVFHAVSGLSLLSPPLL